MEVLICCRLTDDANPQMRGQPKDQYFPKVPGEGERRRSEERQAEWRANLQSTSLSASTKRCGNPQCSESHLGPRHPPFPNPIQLRPPGGNSGESKKPPCLALRRSPLSLIQLVCFPPHPTSFYTLLLKANFVFRFLSFSSRRNSTVLSVAITVR